MPATLSYRAPVPWSDAERDTLRQLWENGLGPVHIARMLGRTKYAVGKQVKTLRLGPRGSVTPPPAPPPVVRQPRPQPLRPGAHTLPPLPSELQGN